MNARWSWVTRCVAMCAYVVAGACNDPKVPQSSFYDERIDPILQVGCVQQTAGCHLASDSGSAAGNLDLSSFDALMRRQDVLPAYGPYPVGVLLLKGGPSTEVAVEIPDPDPTSGERFVNIETDIRHNAGSLIAIDSAGFNELNRWIAEGARRTGVAIEEESGNIGDCVSGVGEAFGFDPGSTPEDADSFRAFIDRVQPVLRDSCAGANCHGNRFADLFLSCGDTDEELHWNYFASVAHLTTPASSSGLLRRPLSSLRGGTFHEGGNVLPSTDDDRYRTIAEWADDIVERRPDLLEEKNTDPGFRFFANRVQPVFVRKGCMFLNCHSTPMFHDLRLRGGARGTFSRIATERNYEMAKAMLAVESPSANNARLIAKNLFPPEVARGGRGIPHRGGSLFEDFGVSGSELNPAAPEFCDMVDSDSGNLNEIPAYCVLVRWHEIERQAAIDRGELSADTIDRLVWVSRPPGIGDIRDFDTFRGGADLRSAAVTVDVDGSVSLGTSESLLANCGLGANPDVRNPAASWDGRTLAFAGRESASQPLRIYTMNVDGSDCRQLPGIASSSDMQNGIFIHDFNPAFAPDGRIVFASTRGNINGNVSYEGPTRTPAAMQPNANLYIFESDQVRQLTFLLNQEIEPSFMSDGRVIFTSEKREPGFHQLALRRQNLDGGDYHPLFAQRASVGFRSATEVVELVNRDFAFVAGPIGTADGAGTIITLNRSIGPDQNDRDPGDRAYIHSMRLPVPGAVGPIPGIPGSGTAAGVFRSPAALPTGRMVVSCELDATDTSSGSYAYSLCELEPNTDTVRLLGGEPGQANVEAVAVYPRSSREIFESRVSEPNGASLLRDGEQDAVVHMEDFPLLATLLFANTRVSRPISEDVGGFELYEALPPPASATTFADVSENVVDDEFGQVFRNYQLLGNVPLNADGSARYAVPGGAPLVMRVIDRDGEPIEFADDGPLSGELFQREQMQFYPGEQARQGFPRRLFNAMCGGCHGSISGRELDIAVSVDVLTSASRTMARDQSPIDLRNR